MNFFFCPPLPSRRSLLDRRNIISRHPNRCRVHCHSLCSLNLSPSLLIFLPCWLLGWFNIDFFEDFVLQTRKTFLKKLSFQVIFTHGRIHAVHNQKEVGNIWAVERGSIESEWGCNNNNNNKNNTAMRALIVLILVLLPPAQWRRQGRDR